MESFLPSKSSERKEEESQTCHNKYREIISTLPKKDDWKTIYPLYQYQCFWYFPNYLEGIMAAQENFKVQPNDIVICSHPKTGTTWLKALTFAIVTRTGFDDFRNHPLLTKMPHDCVPFIEMDVAQNLSNRDLEIPLIATHIPYSSLPQTILASSCKIVYICRDPKDVFISQWNFKAKLIHPTPISIEEAFELFCEGTSCYGPYWEHVLEYWRASLECPERVLFLKYEDMRNEAVAYVKRLAEFMGYPLTLEEERQGMAQKIIDMCSFENLRNLEVNKNGKRRPGTQFSVENSAFFRKGKIGDWKNYLTLEMGARMDRIMEQKLSGSGLTFISHQMHD